MTVIAYANGNVSATADFYLFTEQQMRNALAREYPNHQFTVTGCGLRADGPGRLTGLRMAFRHQSSRSHCSSERKLQMNFTELRELIREGNLEGVKSAISDNPDLLHTHDPRGELWEDRISRTAIAAVFSSANRC